MTPEQWNECTEPGRMLDALCPIGKERRLRLFAAACFRHIWPLLPDERSRDAVEAIEASDGAESRDFGIERNAEEAVAVSASLASRTAARAVVNFIVHSRNLPLHTFAPLPRERYQMLNNFPRAAADAARRAVALACDDNPDEAVHREQLFQSEALRDIFGNPFQPTPAIAPAWLTWNGGIVFRLAQAAYNYPAPNGALDNSRLLVLGDALEEAGCTDTEILRHLRSDAEHWRGCFVVDALLGKGDA